MTGKQQRGQQKEKGATAEAVMKRRGDRYMGGAMHSASCKTNNSLTLEKAATALYLMEAACWLGAGGKVVHGDGNLKVPFVFEKDVAAAEAIVVEHGPRREACKLFFLRARVCDCGFFVTA